jgi:hypothetical protein
MTAKLHPFWRLKAPSITCPEGEQITNGDFEDGDFTGWVCDSGVVQSDIVHAGVWAAQIYPSGSRLLSQTLAVEVPVECVQTFTLWYKQSSGSSRVEIIYTDDTETEYDMPNTTDWEQLNLATDLEAGKTIKEIHIHNGYVAQLYVDDVTLISGA